LAARPTLFAALAEAHEVRFAGTDAPGERGLDALVSFAGPDRLDERSVGRRLVLSDAAGVDGVPTAVTFGASPALDARLRRRTLIDDRLAVAPIEAVSGDDVLAMAATHPLWIRRGDADIVGCAPAELPADGYLRDELAPRSFARLLPLVHFLRDVTRAAGWRRPAPRAAFVIDDPNLHWPTYGYVRYPELARHGRDHGYHIVMAMVPADAWFAHPRAVRLFRAHGDVLSLAVHGNDHRHHDLRRPSDHTEAMRILTAAQSRIARFERRTGLSVDRVMLPPHEAASQATVDALAEAGFDAAMATRPYLWLPWGDGHSDFAAPEPGHLLSAWRMAELMGSGLPVFLRRGLEEEDAAVIASFLDQPIVLYAHGWDLADGLEPLERAAAHVNTVPGVGWHRLADIAAANFETRLEGDTLRLRPYARRV
jgi:hypothetical protein